MIEFRGLTNELAQVKFIRMKIKLQNRQNATLGEHLMLEFELEKHPRHWCQVYKRVRRDPELPKLLVRDWRIQVTQMDEPHSVDYIVVRRAPVKLS